MKAKKHLMGLVAGLLALSLTACSVGQSILDTATGTSLQTSSVSVQAASADSAGSTAAVSTGPASAVAALAENTAADEQAADYTWDEAGVVAITLSGDAITAGAGVQVQGTQATITAAGTYRLSGTLTEGQIVVDTADKGTVQLILDGVSLHNSTSAALYVAQAKKVVLILAAGTTNQVSDGASYVFANPVDTDPNAAIFSHSDLTIAGDGALTVTGSYQDGLTSQDGLLIAGGTLTVTAVDDGLRGKDYLVVEAGQLTVNAGGDGLKSDNAEDAALGYISLQAGTFSVTAGADAIQAETDVLITGGTFTLQSGGGAQAALSADASAKGIRAKVNLNIDAGTFTIDSADDALHSNDSLTINGGTFTLASGDDGLHADAALTINGGDVRITRSYEGVESAVITLNAGTLAVVASDDGLNVAAGNDGSGQMGWGPGGQGQDTFASANGQYLYINGGTITVNASGDGIDINGAVAMTGGTLIVSGPTEQMNGALDFDAGFSMTGGVVAAAGSSGMAMTPDATSSQPALLIYFDAVQAAGTLVNIQDSAGQSVLTFAPAKEFQSLAFASAALKNGETYTVYLGGSAAGTTTALAQTAGAVYTDGAYTPGTQAASFTISSVVTTVGNGGMRGPGGPRQRP